MKIHDMTFKVTTAKIKCNNCKCSLKGEEGYIHITCEHDRGYNYGINNIRICWKCMRSNFVNWEVHRKTRKEKYSKLLKEAIFRRLK